MLTPHRGNGLLGNQESVKEHKAKMKPLIRELSRFREGKMTH